jgi:hypothetical protein
VDFKGVTIASLSFRNGSGEVKNIDRIYCLDKLRESPEGRGSAVIFQTGLGYQSFEPFDLLLLILKKAVPHISLTGKRLEFAAELVVETDKRPGLGDFASFGLRLVPIRGCFVGIRVNGLAEELASCTYDHSSRMHEILVSETLRIEIREVKPGKKLPPVKVAPGIKL